MQANIEAGAKATGLQHVPLLPSGEQRGSQPAQPTEDLELLVTLLALHMPQGAFCTFWVRIENNSVSLAAEWSMMWHHEALFMGSCTVAKQEP